MIARLPQRAAEKIAFNTTDWGGRRSRPIFFASLQLERFRIKVDGKTVRRHPRACPEDLLPVAWQNTFQLKETELRTNKPTAADPRDKPEDDVVGADFA